MRTVRQQPTTAAASLASAQLVDNLLLRAAQALLRDRRLASQDAPRGVLSATRCRSEGCDYLHIF